MAGGNEDNMQIEHFNQFARAIFSYFCDADVETEKKKRQTEC